MSFKGIECPLCCDHKFSTNIALKEHLIAISRNLFCPLCGKDEPNLEELAEHIGSGCTNETDNTQEPDDDCQEEDNINYVSLEENAAAEIGEFYCEVCQMNVTNVEEHIAEFHEGDEVHLENEETPNKDPIAISQEASPSKTKEKIIVKEESFQDEVRDKNGMLYTRKMVRINNFATLIPPIIERFKVSQSEALECGQNVNGNDMIIITVNKCPNCSLRFSKLDHYNKHVCNISKVSYQCSLCPLLFESFQKLQQHKQEHETAPESTMGETFQVHKCDRCATAFLDETELKNHIKTHDIATIKQVKKPKSLKIQVAPSMFTCEICNQQYDTEFKDRHMLSHVKNSEHVCYVCNKTLYSKANLEMHMKAHSMQKKFTCSNCKKTFNDHESLQVHTTQACGQRNFECSYCGRKFSRSHERVKHERIHTGSKPYKCSVCNKTFRVSYCLTLHMRTHTNQRPYHCQVCNKRFKSHSVYGHHMKTHSEERNYKCPFCPKAFKTSVQLSGHKNSHTKPFPCQVCNRPFSTLYAVRAHMETHNKENNLRFECQMCGAIYARAFALKDHLRDHHNVNSMALDSGELFENDESGEELEESVVLEGEGGVAEEQVGDGLYDQGEVVLSNINEGGEEMYFCAMLLNHYQPFSLKKLNE